MNTNDKTVVNKIERQKTPSLLLNKWIVPKYPAKIREEYKSYNTNFGHANYYNPFYLYMSKADKEDNNNKNLIKILKEIKRRKDTTILVKEARKKMRITNSEK